MTNDTIEERPRNNGVLGSSKHLSGPEDRIATFADYLMQPAFLRELDDIVFTSTNLMPISHVDFADFAEDHLDYDDWEGELYAMMELADHMVNSGKYLRQIIDGAPEHAVPLSLAREHAAVIAAAEVTKKKGVREVEAKIDAYWESEEAKKDDGVSKFGPGVIYSIKDGVLSVEHMGRTKSIEVGDADPETLAIKLVLELKVD